MTFVAADVVSASGSSVAAVCLHAAFVDVVAVTGESIAGVSVDTSTFVGANCICARCLTITEVSSVGAFVAVCAQSGIVIDRCVAVSKCALTSVASDQVNADGGAVGATVVSSGVALVNVRTRAAISTSVAFVSIDTMTDI